MNMNNQNIFFGMSTAAGATVNTSKVFDIDLIKIDLLNQFNTRLGERVMNPNFGSIVWDLIFEPLTPDIENKIREDINKILLSEPRVETEQVVVQEFENGYAVFIDLIFKPFDIKDELPVIFDRRTALRGTL